MIDPVSHIENHREYWDTIINPLRDDLLVDLYDATIVQCTYDNEDEFNPIFQTYLQEKITDRRLT